MCVHVWGLCGVCVHVLGVCSVCVFMRAVCLYVSCVGCVWSVWGVVCVFSCGVFVFMCGLSVVCGLCEVCFHVCGPFVQV